MKRFILLAALAASFSIHAETLEAENTQGGKIVLTDVTVTTCKDGQRLAYNTQPNGEALFGCWVVLDDRFFVKYSSGKVMIYEPDGFVLKGRTVKPTKSQGM